MVFYFGHLSTCVNPPRQLSADCLSCSHSPPGLSPISVLIITESPFEEKENCRLGYLLPVLHNVNVLNTHMNRHSSAVAASGKATGKRWVGDDVATPDPGMGPNKRRKKRKPRLPKDFDPAKPGLMPDAERWLPTKERSTYRKTKRDKKNAAQMRGPQGATVSAALDISTAKSTATAAAGSSATQLGEGGTFFLGKKNICTFLRF
ncbi:hypothetical protein T492DRAFT_269495 [Pavlovales sp. CCMP2436]|nr:hypothetical protein T492DRAFT_269495 [Pavlovales sp. CCMP2436]